MWPPSPLQALGAVDPGRRTHPSVVSIWANIPVAVTLGQRSVMLPPGPVCQVPPEGP